MITNKRVFWIQALLIILIAGICYYFYTNINDHLEQSKISSGFEFLHENAGFEVIMSLIKFSPDSSNLRAFFVGVLNTLLVSALAIVLSSIFGSLLAHSRLSRNWLLKQLAHGYVNLVRNLPILLLVLFFYFLLLQYMPQPEASFRMYGITANVRGITFGSITIIPEFTAMLLALTAYSAAYIAEHIRHGLQSVDKGQIEAAIVCCLSPWQRFRLVVFPQAARVMIPPIITQHLTTLKNSSLGVAIGYPELVSVFEGSVLNHTGQAIEPIFMTMSFYLLVSILTSYLTTIINRKMVIPGK